MGGLKEKKMNVSLQTDGVNPIGDRARDLEIRK